MAMSLKLNIIGNRYGRLVVLNEVDSTGKPTRFYNCKCDCGNNKIISQSSLTRGQAKSCGCLARENASFRMKNNCPVKKTINIIGNKFGRLTVVKEIEQRGYARMYACVCGCGVKTIAWQSQLLTGNKKSCGCLRRENTSKMFINGSNEIIKHKSYAEVIMVNNHGECVGKAIIDLCDIKLVKPYRWQLSTKGYALTRNNGKTVHMHRLIHPTGKQADHINGNSLDNRRSNLRDATNQQNSVNQKIRSTNTSGVTGVRKNGNKWHAELFENGNKHKLGNYDNIIDGTNARHEAEIKYFGEFAPCLCRADQGGGQLVN